MPRWIFVFLLAVATSLAGAQYRLEVRMQKGAADIDSVGKVLRSLRPDGWSSVSSQRFEGALFELDSLPDTLLFTPLRQAEGVSVQWWEIVQP
ncbi:hypothetical protein LLH00_00660 [bacterium]|nr:hypothetical protein [bacterium]